MPGQPSSVAPPAHARSKISPATTPDLKAHMNLQIHWDTTGFNDPNDWPLDGSQPFYISTGDNTGYSQHGDYVFGCKWPSFSGLDGKRINTKSGKDDSLQRALDSGCIGAACGDLPLISNDKAVACKVPERVDEKWEGCKSRQCPYSSRRILEWKLTMFLRA